MKKISKKDRIKGSLIGGAIGDALGYQIEFETGIKDKQVTKFKNIGIISDDTQMTLFTANALLWRTTRSILKGIATLPVDAIYLGYLDWLETQTLKKTDVTISWIKELKELQRKEAPGTTCLTALLSGVKGTIERPINDSKGCGGIMRVAPIGLYINDSKEVGRLAAESTALTHGHPLGIIPSYVLATMIHKIVYEELDIENALEMSMQQFLANYNIFAEENTQEFIDIINKAVNLSKSDISDLEAIKQLGEGWVAEEAFAIALYSCLKYKNNFKDAVVCAINHDGDSDSTGSIAGNIIGAYLGLSKIPNYYVNNLESKELILEIANDLSCKIPLSSMDPKKNDEYWLSKYLYCQKDVSKRKKSQNKIINLLRKIHR